MSVSSWRARVGSLILLARRPFQRLQEMIAEVRASAQDRELVRSLRGRTDLRLNIGSSSSHLEGWLNADLLRDPQGRCIRMDATQPWPFEAGSAEAVNS